MITILLATYNGEEFIEEQIDSLLNQTVQDFKLYIRDDLSTDGTYSILERYQSLYPEKIFISRSEANSGNAKFNFITMMIEQRDNYLMLCDQDDVWLPNKIEITLSKMKEMELKYGEGTPILVHTDLVVVDENLEVLSPSFMNAMVANYHKTSLNSLLAQNTLTGCTAMYNMALANLLYKEPPFMVMHDWWLILVASTFGEIASIMEPTILYRQHKRNEIGARDMRTLKYKLSKCLKAKEIKKAIRETYVQADSLMKVYGTSISPKQAELIRKYSSLPKLSKWRRIIELCRMGTFKNGLARKIAQIIYV